MFYQEGSPVHSASSAPGSVLRIFGGDSTREDEKDQEKTGKLILVLEAARFMIELFKAVFL